MINGMMMCNKTKSDIYELTVGSYASTNMYGTDYGYWSTDNIGNLSPNDIDGKIIKSFFYDYGRGEYLRLYFFEPVEEVWAKKIIVQFIDYDNYEVHLYQDRIGSNLFSSEVGSTLPQIFLENIGKTIRIMMRKEVRK